MVFLFGIVFALASVFGGYVLHHGPMGVFIDAWTEYIVIFGSGIGLFIAANGMEVVKRTMGAVKHLLGPDHYMKPQFLNLMAILYQLFVVARKDGILALEGHVENPETSAIFSKYPEFLHNHHAVQFLCDNVKIIMGGGIPPHDLDEMMEMDLETMSKEAHVVPEAVQNAADAMPALGIVACVLGVVITMGKIGGDPREIGASVGVALVGTFLGIGVSYLILAPLARALALRHTPAEIYMNCIRHSLHSFARGEAPMICVEFARRNVPPERRPGLVEAEKFCKESGKSG